MLQKVAFTMYAVTDMKRARAFYEDTLGLPKSSYGEQSPWVEFDLPGGGCLAITNVVPDHQPSAKAGGTIAFEVDDLPAMLAGLKAKGVTITAEDIESPVCRMAVCTDPDGNSIILHKLKDDAERAA